jgi:lipopolysaccharide export LptBFGC system permease protein LptF
MKTSHRNKYITGEFLINFLFSFIILSFIFSLRGIFRIVEFLTHGGFVPLTLIQIFLSTFVSALPYIIPLTFLCATTALFARLKADRELLIFASSGISFIKLLKILALFSFITTLFLIYFNLFLLPGVKYNKRENFYRIRVKEPLTFLKEKNLVNEIPGMTIYVEKLFSPSDFGNISITRKEDSKTIFLRAMKGSAEYNDKNNDLIFNLENGFLLTYGSGETISRLNFKKYKFVIALPRNFKRKELEPRISEMSPLQLMKEDSLEASMEVNERILFGITPLIFLFLGSGLGFRIIQKSKIFHIGLGGCVSILFFSFLLIGETISRKIGSPFYIWLPAVIFIFTSWLLWRE